MSKEALKLALEALEVCEQSDYGRKWIWPETARPTAMGRVREAITAIKQALAAPVQEPVAWCSQCGHKCPQTINQEPIGWWDAKLGFFEEKHFDQLQPLYTTPPAAHPATEKSSAVQPAPVQKPEYVYTCNGCDTLYREDDVSCDCTVNGLMEFTRHILAPDATPPAQEIVCSTGLCHYKPAAPVQEPVALAKFDGTLHWIEPYGIGLNRIDGPLYTAPPAAQRPWIGLSPVDRGECLSAGDAHGWIGVMEATETKLKEKNT